MNSQIPITQSTYSLIRILLGLYLLQHFLYLIPYGTELFSQEGLLPANLSPLLGILPNPLLSYDTASFVALLLVLGSLGSIAIIFGTYDRISSLFIILLLGWLYTRNPLIVNPSMPVVGWMLLLHIMLPRGNYGTYHARGKMYDWVAWSFPKQLWFSAWVLLAVAYSYSGYTKLMSPSWIDGSAIRLVLENPLARDYFLRDFLLSMPAFLLQILAYIVIFTELFFILFVLWVPTRKLAWLVMLLAQVGFLLSFDFADLTLPMFLFHILTFDRRWISAYQPKENAILFYDGTCAFCNGIIRFSLVEDNDNLLTFSPLQGELIKVKGISLINTETIILHTQDGKTYYKSDAAIALFERLGGIWFILAKIVKIIPKIIRDTLYDFIAKIRYKLAGKRENQTCPLLPKNYQSKILL